MPTVQIIIKGKVQGVFYRASAKKMANSIGVTGWVKNTEEGHVEGTVTGTQAKLDEFIKWCKSGPKNAKVNEVVSVEQEEETWFEAFVILR